MLFMLLSCSFEGDAPTSIELELKDFTGSKTIVLSHDSSEGDISWDVLLDSGVLEISYSSGLNRHEHLVTVSSGNRTVGRGGYRDGRGVKVHLKALEPVTGEVRFSTGI